VRWRVQVADRVDLSTSIGRGHMAGSRSKPNAARPRGRSVWLACTLGCLSLQSPHPTLAGTLDILAHPQICRLQAVSLGQFRGLDYGPGVPSGTSVIILAASPDDLRRARIAMIEGNSATVAHVISTDQQVLLVETDPNGGTATLSLFKPPRNDGGLPAVLSRQQMFGTVPVVIQSTGSCRPEPPQFP
jgi:hypothetical protein